jgi:uncharacterized membrane protein (DUF4010 family)
VNGDAWTPAEVAPFAAFLTSLAIGLLMGVERERAPSAKAGLRTFALTSVFGTLAAMLGEQAGGEWLPAVGLAIVGLAIVAAYHHAPAVAEEDPGTTTVIALVSAYALGVLCWYGERSLAVALAVAITALLYFKPELRGLLDRFERRDLLSVLQFATLSFVILPVLPDRPYGPYGALNPYEIWLMVVLVSGLSLAGYIALKLVGARHGLALVGLLGGLVSSTATTLIYSRHARAKVLPEAAAGTVILVANLVVLARIAVLSAAVAPGILPTLVPVAGAALAAGAAATFLFWRRGLGAGGELPVPRVANPTELRAAFGFGLLFAVVLVLATWLSDVAGRAGLYAVAVASGLTDVDALTLSTLRLFSLGTLPAADAVVAVAIAYASNMAFKLGLVLSVGGRRLARQVILPALAPVAGGLAALLLW